MGDMADDFRFMKKVRLEERNKVEPTRYEYAVDKLMEAGHTVGKNPHDDKSFIVNGYIAFWPYTGWYSGKGIGSGRGIHNLIKKLKEPKL
jgi:hypothetical protein